MYYNFVEQNKRRESYLRWSAYGMNPFLYITSKTSNIHMCLRCWSSLNE
nr:MAG TPA_asm: hypothetical protein [Caudoviricetes sp.]